MPVKILSAILRQFIIVKLVVNLHSYLSHGFAQNGGLSLCDQTKRRPGIYFPATQIALIQ